MRDLTLGSLILASRDPQRLRRWYVEAFGVEPDADGFLGLGDVAVLVSADDTLSDRTLEPGRVLVNVHVVDIERRVADLARRFPDLTWVAPLEHRAGAGAWFATLVDPDGNRVQLIELTPAYWSAKREREQAAGGTPPPIAILDAEARLPVHDLERARRWYEAHLGLVPADQRDGGLLYRLGATSFALFESTGEPSGTHTQLALHVADIDAAVAEVRARGLVLDDVDGPGLDRAANGVVTVPGHYPSTGATGERAVWFHDLDGNLIGMSEPTHP
jgi:catechol 2,3-dioxygenase-like lactoylglutathione lyase family enzyme